jgi:hypothetical protein
MAGIFSLRQFHSCGKIRTAPVSRLIASTADSR